MEDTISDSKSDDSKKESGKTTSKSKASQIILIESIVAADILLLGFCGLLSHSASGIFMGIGGLFLGAMLLVRVLQWRQINALTQKYMVFLKSHPDASVHDLAISMKTDPGTVKENFALFAKRGLLVDVVVDEQNGEIIIGTDGNANSDAKSPDDELVEVECQGCGARKMMSRGSKSACDHCGGELFS